MKINDIIDHDLESFRRASVAAVMKNAGKLKKLAEEILGENVLKVKPTGDVLLSGEFTPDTEVEVTFELGEQCWDLDEEASEKLTEALVDHPLEPFGVLTCKVYRS